MKKFFALLLLMLITCGCGMVEGGKCDVPAFDITYTEKSGNRLRLSVENNTENILVCEGYRLQRKENDRWILIEPDFDGVIGGAPFVCKGGESAEWIINFEPLYSELNSGWYCIVLEGFYGEENRRNWYNRTEFILN